MYLKISIVTVVYNAVNTIERTIKSVINQSYKNIEYIIIDGGSIDGTQDVIKKYENRIAFWISEKDEGIYDAMNKGIQYSTGDIIAFLNADDFYVDDIFKRINELFSNNPVDVIYGNVKSTYINGYEIISKPIALNNLNIRMCVCHQAVFSKKELFFKYGLFNLDYKIAADYDAILKWYNAEANFMYIDEIIVNYGVDGFSSVQLEECAKEVKRIAISYLDSEAKKQKYIPLIEQRYILSVKKAQRKKKLRHNEKDILENLKLFLSNGKRIYIFGCGCESVDSYKFIKKCGFVFNGYIDNDSNKYGMKIKESCVYSPDILRNERAKVIISTVKYGVEIANQLEGMGYKHKEDFIFLDDLLI